MQENIVPDHRIAVHSEQAEWTSSSVPGVERRVLDRKGDCKTRPTTHIARFAPECSLQPQDIPGENEFFVLDGMLQDKYGDFPAGTYVRNPPDAVQVPKTGTGCTIFLKQCESTPQGPTRMRIQTNKMRFVLDPERAGVTVVPLFHDGREDVMLERWEAGVSVCLKSRHGMEMLVVEGSFEESGEVFEHGSWLKLTGRTCSHAVAGDAGAKVWVRRKHLT